MDSKKLITDKSVILVTGGARGITARCVTRLAEKFRCSFILIGRTNIQEPLPNWYKSDLDEKTIKSAIHQDALAHGRKILPAQVERIFRDLQSKDEILNTLSSVRNYGSKVEYISIDINKGNELKREVNQVISSLGAITGVIHGAGALADKLIEKKTSEDFDKVVFPKVLGFENIMRVISMEQVKFIVLFSSVVGFFGNPGQADYALANEVLNRTAFLVKHKFPHCHVISMGWGPWDAGMVTPEIKKVFEERKIDLIPVEVGAQMLLEELENPHEDDTQLIIGSFPSISASLLNSDLHTYQIRRQLKLDLNPFLFDHQIGSYPVLPATCAANWIVNLCEQLYPGFKFFSLNDFKVLKGIVFDEALAKEHILDLKEIEKNEEKIQFFAKVWSLNHKGRQQFHYSVQVELRRKIPAPPVLEQLSLISSPSLPVITGSDLYQKGILFHGTSFQGVEKVLSIAKTNMTVQCILPRINPMMQGQFPVQATNPYIYDAIVQCILIWAQHFYQAPCLPSRLSRLEQYKELPFDEPLLVHMVVDSETDTSIVGNITVTNQKGETCVIIRRLEGTISKQLRRFFSN